MPNKSVFQTLNEYDVTPYLKEKNKLSYLPWSNAWTIIKSLYPDSTYEAVKDEAGNIYHTDGKTCWVETKLTVADKKQGIEETQHETLAVMDFKNKSITADTVTSVDVGKSIKRALVKSAALFGLGLSLWVGEELSNAAKRVKAEKSAEEEAIAAELHKRATDIINLAKTKIAAGLDKDTVYKVISDNNNGKQNPNSIKDVETANKIYELINNMEVANAE